MIRAGLDENTRLLINRQFSKSNEELEKAAGELFNFLRAMDFEILSGHTLPRLTTDSPTQSTIEGIFLFLRQQIDPNQLLGEGFKAAFLKLLRYTEYPGVSHVRKPSLANAPAIWPLVLDGLHWLMCISYKTNQFRLGGEISNIDRPMLDALFERNVSKQYQVEITPDGADPKSFQHDLHLGLERYTAAITEAVGVLEKQRATALSQTTRLRDQISKFESSAVENSLTDSKMGHVEVELQKISADRKYLQEKLSNLERRKNEIAKRRIEIRTIQSDFKAQVCDQSALGVSYTEDILEDFLKQYRSTLLMQINELRELKSLSLKKSAMLNGVEEKFEFVHSATERYNLLADVPVKIRITHVLDNDLGKSAKSLTGRTLFEIQKELEQAIIYHNNQIERLRVKIIKQDKAREALETTHGPIINEKLKMSEKLQHKRCNIEANRCSLENDRVLLAKWVGEVEEENARSLSSTSEKETNAHSDVDKAKICFDKERMENLATISPLEDRLIDRYDEFSRVYNQIGASFNGMLTSSTQVVKSTEEDIRLSNFKNPLQFTCDFNVTENLFSQYSSVLSSRANHA